MESEENWADRSEPPGDTRALSQEAEEEGDSESMEVSEPTHHLLTLVCTRSMSNDQRRETRKRYKLLRVSATKTPRLDAFMKAEAPQNAKSLDGELAHIQTLVMDTAAPLTSLIEERIQEGENEGNTPEAQQLADAITASLALIGNAHSHISQLRREKVITSLNKSLLPLLKDDVDFATAVPFLFGTDFAKRSKDFLHIKYIIKQYHDRFNCNERPEAYKHSGSTSWKAGTLSKQLEGCYKRQVGTGHSEWVPDRVPFTSLSGLPTPPTTVKQGPRGPDKCGNSKIVREGAVTTVHSPQKDSFVSTLFLIPKKDGGQRPVINLKPLNNFVNTPHFKMEGIHSLKTLLRRGTG
uniref:Uncharacterized protein n=1 Tax=Amphimedon queenslandica TaxID=400682 RepID=A0A1X7VIX4_AMPQE